MTLLQHSTDKDVDRILKISMYLGISVGVFYILFNYSIQGGMEVDLL